MYAFTIKQISFKYKTDDILKMVSFTVSKGEFLTIVGPNGTGKTTLLRLLAGMLTPYEGTILLDETDIKKYKRKEIAKKIALVSQNFFVEFPFTVKEVVLMGRYPYQTRFGTVSKNDIKICDDAMASADITHLQEKVVFELSAGELQRVLIARALCQTPSIILLDEPTAHLDINHQIEILTLIKKLNKNNGLTVLNVSHDLNAASLYSDKIMLLKNKRIFMIGEPKEVITKENIKAVFNADVNIRMDEGEHPYVVLKEV